MHTRAFCQARSRGFCSPDPIPGVLTPIRPSEVECVLARSIGRLAHPPPQDTTSRLLPKRCCRALRRPPAHKRLLPPRHGSATRPRRLGGNNSSQDLRKPGLRGIMHRSTERGQGAAEKPETAGGLRSRGRGRAARCQRIETLPHLSIIPRLASVPLAGGR